MVRSVYKIAMTTVEATRGFNQTDHGPDMIIKSATVESWQERETAGKEGFGKSLSDVLVLSSSLLTDRILLHTRFLEVLSSDANVWIWATSSSNPRFQKEWDISSAIVEEFPGVLHFKDFPYSYLRRLNEFVWDFRQYLPSRLSMWRHVRKNNQKLSIRALRWPARLLAMAKAEEGLEDYLEKLLLSYPRSPQALARLSARPPHLLITTGPFQFEQPAVVALANNLGIPTMALIPSWDNLSTKNRLVFKYDGYLVWSEKDRQELHHYYPYTRQVPIYVVGAPQFDVFFQDRFFQSREEFAKSQGLRADLPIIVYALGSPNFLKEHYGALDMAERVARGDLGEAQLLIRPHPIHDNHELTESLRKYYPQVIVQQTSEAGTPITVRSQDEGQIVEWINTFRHADVVVNLASTVTIDAAIFDSPVVNIDYDPQPGQPKQALVKDINHLWTHFKPVAESGGVWLVNNPDEMVQAVRTYLEHPELHRDKRSWIAEYVCQYLDGRCGERMASAVLDFVHAHVRSASQAGVQR